MFVFGVVFLIYASCDRQGMHCTHTSDDLYAHTHTTQELFFDEALLAPGQEGGGSGGQGGSSSSSSSSSSPGVSIGGGDGGSFIGGEGADGAGGGLEGDMTETLEPLVGGGGGIMPVDSTGA